MKHLSSSVIICTRNRLPDVLVCLRSLACQTAAPQQIIVVDSSDIPLIEQPEFKALFTQQSFADVQLIYQHSAPGLTYQRNQGIALASSDLIYFFDDDVILESDYLEQMNCVFVQHPEYAGGMGTVTNIPDYRMNLFRVLRTVFLLQRIYASGNFTWSGIPTHAYGATALKTVQVLGGCCMTFRRSILRQYLFDESLGRYAYMEDADISKRISDHYPLFFNPQARLEHRESPLARDRIIDNRAMYIKNYSYLFFKNFYPQNRLKVVCYWWSVLGLFVEAVLFRRWEFCRGYWRGMRAFWQF